MRNDWLLFDDCVRIDWQGMVVLLQKLIVSVSLFSKYAYEYEYEYMSPTFSSYQLKFF